MDWTVRGSVSHIDAKSTLWEAERSSDCSNFSVNVARQSLFLIINRMILVFAQHYSNNILVFGALFIYSCCSILYFLLPLQWLTTLVKIENEKKKKRMLYNFQEMQVRGHCNLYKYVIHSEYITEFEWYWCLYVWIWLNKI